MHSKKVDRVTKENDHAGLFGLGQADTAYQQYFKGQSYLHSLVGAESEIDVHVANVTFEPGCHNNWHIHHHGFPIFLVTSGEDWSKENELSARDRSLITIACLMTSGDFPQLKAHLKMGKDHGLTKEEVVATITHLAFYAGWYKMWSTMGLAKEVCGE